MIGQDEVQGTNAPTETDGRRGLFVFRVGATWLAVPADRVETVIQTPRPTPLPMVPPHVLGLVPYGQEALAIFDLASFLGMGQALSEEGTGYSRVLVLSTGTLKAAVPVAAAAGVAEVAPDALRAPQVISGERLEAFLAAELDTQAGLTGLLDIDAVLEAARV